ALALAVDPRDRTQSIEGFWTQLETALGLPPSLALADVPRSARSLTMASEPPAPMTRPPAEPAPPLSLARTVQAPRPAEPAPPAPPASRPGPRPRPAAIPFELAER